jgi:hypothetical protein
MTRVMVMVARQAVNYALDGKALASAVAWALEPSWSFLPPNVVGYKELDCACGDPAGEPDLGAQASS